MAAVTIRNVAKRVAKWARAGCEIITVCITSGGAGSNKYTPPDMTRRALVAIREEEQRDHAFIHSEEPPSG